MHFALYELGTRKEIQNFILNEIETNVKESEPITETVLDKMLYLKVFVKEVFR